MEDKINVNIVVGIKFNIEIEWYIRYNWKEDFWIGRKLYRKDVKDIDGVLF